MLISSFIFSMESDFAQTFTLTFGDQGENHVGMQKIGKMAARGFSLADLRKTKKFFEKSGALAKIYYLNKLLDGVDCGDAPQPDAAYVLVVRKGVDALLGYSGAANDLYEEQNGLEKDTKALMYGRVVDKKARHNLCFDVSSQEPDYENGKGRIVGYVQVPITKNVRDGLSAILPIANCIIEGNYYFDPSKCFIGFHGDAERRKVTGIRLGKSFKFHYQWFGIPEYDGEETKKAKAKNKNARDRFTKRMLGPRFEITLDHGDLYVMSEKAVGTDWMSKRVVTLRHAAGGKGLKGLNPTFVGEDFFKSSTVPYKRDEDGYVVVEFKE